jgi:alpha-maltose-1-phosphate synthase
VKVALSTIGKFHSFDLARELYARGALKIILTGYPRFKLRDESLPQELIRTFPFIHGAYMAFPWRHKIGRYWNESGNISTPGVLASMPPKISPNATSMSGFPVQPCGQVRKRSRAEPPMCAIAVLREEHERWGLPFSGFDPRITNAEESEYAEADCITLPSHFTYRSFLSQGFTPEKLRLLNYGVDLSRFEPAGVPAEGKFDVLFVGGMNLRKGVQYLAEAFQRIDHPAKTLSFDGAPSFELIALLRQRKLWPEEARVLGHVPQSQLKTVMSRSHVMVLPRIGSRAGASDGLRLPGDRNPK